VNDHTEPQLPDVFLLRHNENNPSGISV
jgi:hypothetical protein